MRHWKPSQDPEQDVYKITPPDEEYWEIEAAIAGGYTLSQWQREDPLIRARMIAHHHEKRLREAHLNNWEREQMRKATKKKTPGGQQANSWSKMKSAWGIGV